jgi:acyl-CoA thioester hydrolase
VKNSFKQRIIYQDTDAEGVVYYANYLGYFERGRMELMRQMGIPPKRLKEEKGVVFAITKVECNYHAPALLDDEVTVETQIIGNTLATITFDQRVLRGDKVLVSARIDSCAINMESFKPTRIPDELLEKLK